MNKIVKYNLEIMSCIFAVIVAVGLMNWGVLLTVVSFFIMETQFLKTAGITIKEFQTSMRNHMLGRIKELRK